MGAPRRPLSATPRRRVRGPRQSLTRMLGSKVRTRRNDPPVGGISASALAPSALRRQHRWVTSSPAAESTLTHLGQLAEHHVARHGDYPFIFFDGAWHSSGTLLQRSRRIAAGLRSRGAEPGDRIVVTMPNSPDVPVLYNAIWRMGGVVTPAMFLMSPPELRHVIEDSGAIIVVTTADLAPNVFEAIDGLDRRPEVISVDEALGAISLSDLETSGTVDVVDQDPEGMAALLYTGGTTGRAKGVMLSHVGLLNAALSGAAYEEVLPLERELVTLPLSHAFGLLATIGALTSTLQKVWVMPRRFVPKTILALMSEHRIGLLQAVPSMLQMLLAEPLEDFDLSSLRVVFSGGSSLAPEVFAEFEKRIPSVSILEGYGLTECSTLATGNPVGGVKIGSVGQALPGVELKIVDADGSEVLTRSASLMLGYWGDEQATAEAMRDGWLATGDIGYLDDDGYLFIMDRKKDLIIRSGFNVFPRDIEEALLEHPAVETSAVVGRPDPVHGEEIVAFVGLKKGHSLTVDELTSWSQRRLGAYKWPREVHIVESIPLTGVGKVDRKALREDLSRTHR